MIRCRDSLRELGTTKRWRECLGHWNRIAIEHIWPGEESCLARRIQSLVIPRTTRACIVRSRGSRHERRSSYPSRSISWKCASAMTNEVHSTLSAKATKMIKLYFEEGLLIHLGRHERGILSSDVLRWISKRRRKHRRKKSQARIIPLMILYKYQLLKHFIWELWRSEFCWLVSFCIAFVLWGLNTGNQMQIGRPNSSSIWTRWKRKYLSIYYTPFWNFWF